ncbi:hypothetical protein CLU79DRAFT_805537 [Phycomyces nitens]|nr:hypothetical protein CLU79DRAFT_805537 [Phycomyces nitens]
MLSPATPPYDYDKSPLSPDINSPPELLHDSEDDEDNLLSPFAQSPFYNLLDRQSDSQSRPLSRRKSVPHRSPSIAHTYSPTKGIIFQFNSYNNDSIDLQFNSTPRLVGGESILSALRKKVVLARRQLHHSHKRTRTPTRIQIPIKRSSVPKSPTPEIPLIDKAPFVEATLAQPNQLLVNNNYRPQSGLSGRPTRVKGPCQACHEASDGCMRKAFSWPFPSNAVFKDKGRSFVYLCNKCGLRYNKSNGCVCRHCRWVFCKEEKRKAIQFIDQMRRSRPDGKVDPDEDIEGFVCVPKYWSCGQPWKVGWVLNEMDGQDEEDDYMS